jgi:hypothetical protein
METERTNPAPARRRRPAQKTEKKPKREIAYTQPRPFYRNRLIVQLISIAAVVLAVTIGVSIFFKVDTVTVAGTSKYSAATIAEASAIRPGDSLLFFGRAGAAYKIKSQLPYVDTVRFRLELPGTVNIIIEEKMVAYAIQATDGSWWMMTADGMLAEKTTASAAENGPVIEGVILENPVAGKTAVAAEIGAEDGIATAADRLKVVVQILSQLEKWQLFAPATRIDVSDLFALRLYCGSDYRVELGDSTDMETKIGAVKSALSKPELQGREGVLKLVFNEKTEEWEVHYQSWVQQ